MPSPRTLRQSALSERYPGKLACRTQQAAPKAIGRIHSAGHNRQTVPQLTERAGSHRRIGRLQRARRRPVIAQVGPVRPKPFRPPSPSGQSRRRTTRSSRHRLGRIRQLAFGGAEAAVADHDQVVRVRPRGVEQGLRRIPGDDPLVDRPGSLGGELRHRVAQRRTSRLFPGELLAWPARPAFRL